MGDDDPFIGHFITSKEPTGSAIFHGDRYLHELVFFDATERPHIQRNSTKSSFMFAALQERIYLIYSKSKS